MNPAQGTAQAQPEVADMQQRMRVGTDTLFKELVMAGAGPYQGPSPARSSTSSRRSCRGGSGASIRIPPTVFRTDTITLTYIPNTYSQTTLSQSMPPHSAELKVTDQPNCPQGESCAGSRRGWR